MSGRPHKSSDRCVNPFGKDHIDNHIGFGLRSLSLSMAKTFPSLDPKGKICSACQKKVCAMNVSNSSVSDTSLNESNDSIEQLQKKRCREITSRQKKLEKMLSGLKEKLPYNDPDRLRILTIAPPSWSVRKTALEFDTTTDMAQKAKNLRSSKGILLILQRRVGQTVSNETVEKVKEFFLNDSNSRIMSGKKDVVSVRSDGHKSVGQKRLMLYNLKELHAKYKEENVDYLIGFSKFCQLRPKQCILAGASGTHCVCVCVTHQNCKLMLDAINLNNLTKNSQKSMTYFKDCLKAIMGKESNPDCHLNNCASCPGTQNVCNFLIFLLNEAAVTEITFSVWELTDRATLRTDCFPVEDFMQELSEKLMNLKTHHFIAKEQSNYLGKIKATLKDGEVLVQCDFSENYTFVVQDAAQAFHYNNDQCTLHPFVYYYRKNKKLKHRSILILSNSLSHDTAAVYVSQKIVIKEIKLNYNVKKVIYFTDGAKQHYKNRFNIANLLHHKHDFNVEAEWHFHATAHGKGACDGVAATAKRGAVKASLQATSYGSYLNTCGSLQVG